MRSSVLCLCKEMQTVSSTASSKPLSLVNIAAGQMCPLEFGRRTADEIV